ncbi:MAG: RDD family protein [Bacteroidetes bacterium]|nr:RDD family protein [Bacteroidota bacterium]
MAVKQIEIRTAQSVDVAYELAGVIQRIGATLLDFCVLGLFAFALSLFLGFSGGGLLFQWVLFIGFTFYHLFCEFFMRGRSVGKLILGIRVMRTDGASLTFPDYFLRWIMRPLDLTFSAGALGLLMMLGTENRQRLGDLLAGTVLVKNKPSVHFTLENILNLHATNPADTVEYPEIKHIEEKHILLLKNLLNSRSEYSQNVYNSAVREAALHLAGLLQLHTVPSDPQRFLRKAVNDYIVLTR